MEEGDARCFSAYVDGSETLQELKQTLSDLTGIPVEEQDIRLKGSSLKGDGRLSEFCISKDTTLELSRCPSQSEAAGEKDVECGKSEEWVDELIDSFFAKDYDQDTFGTPPLDPTCTSSCASPSTSFHDRIPQPMPSWFSSMLMSKFLTKEASAAECQGACAVCREDYVVADKVVETPCGHIFHQNCLRPWLGVNTTCPQCRFELSELPLRCEKIAPVEACKVEVDEETSSSVKPPSPANKAGGEARHSKDKAACTAGLVVPVDCFDSGSSVKDKIEEMYHVPAHCQRIMYRSEILADDECLGSRNLREGAEVELIVRLDNAYSQEQPNNKRSPAPAKKQKEETSFECSSAGKSKSSKIELLHTSTSTSSKSKALEAKEDKSRGEEYQKLRPRLQLLSRKPATEGRCAVCQFDYTLSDEVVVTVCQHTFHKNCLEPWLRVNASCPQCRFGLQGPVCSKLSSSKLNKTCVRRFASSSCCEEDRKLPSKRCRI